MKLTGAAKPWIFGSEVNPVYLRPFLGWAASAVAASVRVSAETTSAAHARLLKLNAPTA